MLKKIYKLGRQQLWLWQRDYLREKHELKYLFWECTLNCNFKCKHCGSRAGEGLIQETLTTSEIKKAFLNIAEHFDAKKITIAVTGGEPLLRQDLFDVMKYADSLGFKWGMVTNGFLINKDIVLKAQDANMQTVDVSIDGIGKTHDSFRNAQGAYEKAIQAVKLFAKEKFLHPLRITTTVNSNNINMLEEMYKTFLLLGITSWRLLSVDPIGRSIENSDILLSKQQVFKLLNFIKEKRKKAKIKITYGCAHYLGEEYEDEVRDNFFYCATGINVATILHNGDIFVCPNVPRIKELIQGNIKKDLFSEIWNTKFKIFRNKDRTKSDKCERCEYWNECLGGSFHTWDFEKKKQKICLMK